MSEMLRILMDNEERLKQTETKEVASLYLPWTQRVINPFPLASSGGAWGDSPQPWAVNLLRFTCSVFVNTTNNATNFWTITLVDTAVTTLATLSTSAMAANTFTRLSTTTITQPSSSNVDFIILVTATLAPGSIFIVPALALLRTGN